MRSRQKRRNWRLRWRLWRLRLWPQILRRLLSFPSRKFRLPPPQTPPVSPGHQSYTESAVPGWSVVNPPPPRRLWQWQISTPLSRLRPIWSNLKCEFSRLLRRLHPSLQVVSCSLHPPFQVVQSQILLLIGGCVSDSVLHLCRGSGQSEAIWNVETNSEVFTIFQNSLKLIWKQSEAI